MTQHTPGPWVVFHADEDGPNDVLPAMRPGCIAHDIESVADARLIAAAPDLLLAAKHVFSALETLGVDGWSDAPYLSNLCRAAIAKATGDA